MSEKAPLTAGWVRQFAHQYRQSSYEDKWQQLLHLPNPYYLLEWLLQATHAELRDELRQTRTFGLDPNVYKGFDEVLFDQLVPDLLFERSTASPFEQLLLATALADLQQYYGEFGYVHALKQWRQSISAVEERYVDFQQKLDQELQRLHEKYRKQVQEWTDSIQADSGSDEEIQLKMADLQAHLREKQEQLPKQLLHKRYEDDPTITYMHLRGWRNPAFRFDEAYSIINNGPCHQILHEMLQYLKEMTEPGKETNTDPNSNCFSARPPGFFEWMSAYAAKNPLTRGRIDTSSRRSAWSRILTRLSEQGSARGLTPEDDIWYASTFSIPGIEDDLFRSTANGIPAFFGPLVLTALKKEKHRMFMKDSVILRNWQRFVQRFIEPDYSFHELSWLLCLDPESIETRILRGAAKLLHAREAAPDPQWVMERCGEVFADAVRKGIDSSVIAPILRYLTAHHTDAVYQYIYQMKSESELEVLLMIPEEALRRLLNVSSVRAASARSHLHMYLLSDQINENTSQLLSLGMLLSADKREIALKWMTGHDTPNPFLERALGIQWIGDPRKAEELQHEEILQLLADCSDCIQFENDASALQGTVRYRFVRSGCKDSENGDILIRALVRCEMNDTKAIDDLLGDLRSL